MSVCLRGGRRGAHPALLSCGGGWCSPGDKGVAAIPDFNLPEASRSLGSPIAPPRPLIPTEMVPTDLLWQGARGPTWCNVSAGSCDARNRSATGPAAAVTAPGTALAASGGPDPGPPPAAPAQRAKSSE